MLSKEKAGRGLQDHSGFSRWRGTADHVIERRGPFSLGPMPAMRIHMQQLREGIRLARVSAFDSGMTLSSRPWTTSVSCSSARILCSGVVIAWMYVLLARGGREHLREALPERLRVCWRGSEALRDSSLTSLRSCAQRRRAGPSCSLWKVYFPGIQTGRQRKSMPTLPIGTNLLRTRSGRLAAMARASPPIRELPTDRRSPAPRRPGIHRCSTHVSSP